MKIRRRTVEHVFGTLKLDGIDALPGEDVEACRRKSACTCWRNLKRLMGLLGIAATMKAMRFARGVTLTCSFEARLFQQLRNAGITRRHAYWST